MEPSRQGAYRSLEARSNEVRGLDHEARMTWVVDEIWENLGGDPVSWCGFYLPDPDGPDQLVLGPRRDKPACSPIGLHGVCGQAARLGGAVVVHDVLDLGEDYIACDPRDRSELVIPLFHRDGQLCAVFDLDSHGVGAFDDSDMAGLASLLEAVFAPLSTRWDPEPEEL